MLDLSNEAHRHVDERLRRNLIIWISTVRPDGRPHVAAVWFLWDGTNVLIFSMPNQKVRNLRQNPNVALALDNTDGGGDVITIEGTAELVEDGSISPMLPAYAQKYGEEMTAINLPPERMAKEYSVSIRVTPARLRTVS